MKTKNSRKRHEKMDEIEAQKMQDGGHEDETEDKRELAGFSQT